MHIAMIAAENGALTGGKVGGAMSAKSMRRNPE